jgi:hypothetical protein
MEVKMNRVEEFDPGRAERDKQWKNIYMIGGIAGIVALICILTDVLTAIISGGDGAPLPQTAADRFIQFRDNKLFGLYGLDLLNVSLQILIIPFWYALYAVHRFSAKSYALLALIIFLFGSVVLVSDNAALPMLELSKKYNLAPNEEQKALYSAAGEALLARGAHGSAGMFLGFLIPNIAGLIMSAVMLKAGIFTRTVSWIGIMGYFFMILYVISVTFVPGVDKMATAFAMPGGLLLLAWILLITMKFLHPGQLNA